MILKNIIDCHLGLFLQVTSKDFCLQMISKQTSIPLSIEALDPGFTYNDNVRMIVNVVAIMIVVMMKIIIIIIIIKSLNSLLTIMVTNKSRMINYNTRIANWFDLGTKIQKLIEEI